MSPGEISPVNLSPRERLIHEGLLLSLSAVVFFLPLKIHYANIAVGSAGFFWLLNFRVNRSAFTAEFRLPLLALTSIFLLHLAGMIYTDNLIQGLHILEKKLALLAFPLVFLISNISEKEINRMLGIFVAGVFIACCICVAAKYWHYEGASPILLSFINDEGFQNMGFSAAIPIHPAYLSACIILSVLILLSRLARVTRVEKILYVCATVFFFLILMVLMARGSLIALVLIIISAFFYQAFRRGISTFLVYSALMGVLLIYGSLHFIPNLRERIADSFSGYQKNVENTDEISSVALHYKSWHCAVVSGLNSNGFLGHGTGDEKDVLVDCYTSHGWQSMAAIGYDAHNEYLSAFVRHGLVGLLLFLFVLGYCFFWSVRHDDVVYFSFLLLTAVSAVSESILRGQVSLLFFAFFNACFFKLVWLKRQSRELK